MQVWIERYLEWMQITHYSENTVVKRRSDLHRFHRWCQERALNDPRHVTKIILESYQRSLFYYRKPKNGQPLSFSRQRMLLVSLQGLFKWLA